MQISKLQISRILGSSTHTKHQMCYLQGCLLYVCGSYVIFYHPQLDEQIQYLSHGSANITCMDVWEQGSKLAIGCEGKYNNLWVYELGKIGIDEPKLQHSLKGHKNGVDLVAFSPDGRYLVSVGNKDGSLFIWQGQQRISQNRNSRAIHRILFHPTGDLITIGRGLCKLWPFEDGHISRVREDDCWMINGHTITLNKKLAVKDFVDVTYWHHYLILLSNDGILCLINKKQERVEKCIDLMIENTTSMQMIENTVICGGSNSLIKLINLQNFTLVNKLPKPPPTNKQNITTEEQILYKQNEHFPQCLGIKRLGAYLLTLYENYTMFIWSLQPQIHALRSIITHQNTIFKVSVLEEVNGDLAFFATASTDKTLRIWHYYKKCFRNRESIDLAELIGIKRNAYCRNLTRIIYNDVSGVVAVGGLIQGNVLCLTATELFVYSVETFQMVAHEVLDIQAVDMDIKGGFVYVGYVTGKVTIYQYSEGLHKMRDIEFEQPLKHIHIIQDHIVGSTSTSTLIYSLKRASLSHIENNSTCCGGFGHHVLICTPNNTINLYHTIKAKSSQFMTLNHELQAQQKITKIKCNSWLFVLVTNLQKVIVGNFSPAIICTVNLSEQINDIALTENGEILVVGCYGNVIIYHVENGLQGLEKEMKSWVQRNDMSWMDGSVWMRRKSNAVDDSRSLNQIQKSGSIRLSASGNPDGMNVELPNVQINYKSSENSMSVFNPNQIVTQAHNIYEKVTGIMKNNSQNQDRSGSRNSKRRIFSNNDKKQNQEEESAKGQAFWTEGVSKKFQQNHKQEVGKRASQKESKPPKFRNNLVDSIIHDDIQPTQNSGPSKQKPSEHSFGDFIEEKKSQSSQIGSQSKTKSKSISTLNSFLDDKQFLDENKDELFQVYQKLQTYFGGRERYEKDVQVRFKELSDNFLLYLKTHTNQ